VTIEIQFTVFASAKIYLGSHTGFSVKMIKTWLLREKTQTNCFTFNFELCSFSSFVFWQKNCYPSCQRKSAKGSDEI